MEQPYIVAFEWNGMPRSGTGPVATVLTVDGELPSVLVDVVDQNGAAVRGTWNLSGTDDVKMTAIYQLQE